MAEPWWGRFFIRHGDMDDGDDDTNNNDTDDVTDDVNTDDDNDHKNNNYIASGAAPGANVSCSGFRLPFQFLASGFWLPGWSGLASGPVWLLVSGFRSGPVQLPDSGQASGFRLSASSFQRPASGFRPRKKASSFQREKNGIR